MPPTEMKRSELEAMIADVAGKSVAEIVAKAVAEAMAPFAKQQTDWLATMHGADAGGHNNRGRGVDEAKLEMGMGLGQCLRAMAFSKLVGGGMQAAGQWAKQHAHPEVARAFEEQREKAMAAGEGTAGGFLVPVQYSQEIVTLLRPVSVVRSLGPITLPMPTGTVRIPKVTGGTTGYYVGENRNITPSEMTMGQIPLTWKKLAALVPISNDLIRYSSPGADAMVRDDLVRAIAQREGQAFLRDTGTEFTPKGMRYWAPAANLLTSAGTSLANMITDLSAMILLMKNNLIPMTRPAWILNPRTYLSFYTIQNTNGFFVFRDEMTRGNLWGYPYAVTTQMPGSGSTGEYFLVDMADAVIGESMNLAIDTSMEAAYYDGANVTAAYSQDQTVIRAIEEHDFAMRRGESVVVMSGLSY